MFSDRQENMETSTKIPQLYIFAGSNLLISLLDLQVATHM